MHGFVNREPRHVDLDELRDLRRQALDLHLALNRLQDAAFDDADLALGRVRIKTGGGGAGGNHGVESLLATLGPDFVRVKIGLGRPPAGWDTADYVLAVPSPPEAPALAAAEERAVEGVELVLSLGPERAMNRINQKETAHGGSPL